MATGDKQLQVALLIKANAEQATAQLAEVRAQLAGVSAENTSSATATAAAAAATEQQTSSARDAASAVNALGETEAEASARIHAMVQASMQASDAGRARAQAAIAAATASRTGASADTAAAKSTAELVAAQNAQMAASSRVVAAQAEIAAALKAKSLTEDQSAAAEAAINRAQAAGLITAAEQRQAIERLAAIKVVDTKATEADTVAVVENTAASTLNNRSRRELGTMVSEFASGNFGRVRTSGLALANDMGAFGKLLSPVGLGITGVVAALGALAVAFAKGQSENAAFNDALILTGGYAGKSSAALQAMSIQLDALQGVTEHAAAGVVAAVAATGKFYGDQVQLVAKAALQMQQATGQSLDATIKQFESLGSDPIAGLMKLDDTLHFVTQAVYDQVTALQEQGKTEEAAQVAQDAWAAAIDKRTAAVRQNVGLLQSAWDGLKNVAKEAWDAMLNLGRSDAGAQLQNLRQQLDSNNALIRAAATGPNAASASIQTYIQGLTQQNTQIAQQISQLDGTAAKGAKELSDSLKAQQSLAKAGITPLQTYLQTVAKLTAEYKTAITGAGDDVKSVALTNLNSALAKARESYESSTRTRRTAGPDLGALQARAGVAAIQQSLTTLQNAWQNTQRTLDAQHKAGQLSDQQYFTALKTDLDTYTQQRIATLEQEKAAAQAHVTTAAQRIQADQRVAAIDAQITQTRQDAAAKREQINAQEVKSIDDLRAAWDKLQASVGKNNGAVDFSAFDKAVATANAAQAAGLTDQQGRDRVVNGLVTQTVQGSGAPKYRGLSARTGGAFADYDRAQGAEQAESAYYKQELARLDQFLSAKKITTEQYNAELEQISKSHATQLTKIDQDKNTAILAGLTATFDQTASAMGAAFGQQSTAYRIAFDLAKGAAIAQATVAMFQSIAQASTSPFPANIALMAKAMAQGLSIVADIRAIELGPQGHAAGGHIRGAGSSTSDSIPAMLSNGEYVLRAAAVRAVGVPMLDAINRHGFASGGYVQPFADAPTPAQLGFTAPASPRVDFSKLAAANDGARAPAMGVRIVNSIDPEFATSAMNSAAGEKVIMNVLSRNATKLKQMVR